MPDDTRTNAAPQPAPENETPAAPDTSAPGGLTLSRPGEAPSQNVPQNGPQNIPQTRRGKRTAPTGGEGIPAGTHGRLRIIHN